MYFEFRKPDPKFPVYRATDLVKAWFWYKFIYLGDPEDFKIDYNEVYNFYDLCLYEITGNYGNPKAHWYEVQAWLVAEGYSFKITDTWASDGRQGMRLWITPKDSPDPTSCIVD